jgi:predicted metal-dependent phosphoesterase TrpH
VKDAAATPEAIVALAAQEGLKIIAISNHNEISGVHLALEACAPAGLLVVPALGDHLKTGHM